MYTPSVTYTYPGKLNTEIIRPYQINTPALSDFARIIQGVRCGQYLHLIQPLDSVLTRAIADCNPTYSQSGTITDRRLETGEFELYLEWCAKEFTAVCNALVDSNLIPPGLDGNELGGALQTAIFEQILEAMRKDIWKILLFGDNSLGTGNNSKYAVIDGVWTKFHDSFADYCVEPISNVFPNSHNSTLTTNQAVDVLRQMWSDSDILLKQLPDNQKIFWVTGSVWENYYDSLINDCCVEGSWQASQDGIRTLRYRGIEVRPLWIADQSLQNDTTNPWYDKIRHFIIYTTPDNHMFGVERASDLNNLEMCFDCRTKSNLITARMRLGYNFIQCNLQSIAF